MLAKETLTESDKPIGKCVSYPFIYTFPGWTITVTAERLATRQD